MKIKFNREEKKLFLALCKKWGLDPKRVFRTLEESAEFNVFGHDLSPMYHNQSQDHLEKIIANLAMD